jgi:hypothetical protein
MTFLLFLITASFAVFPTQSAVAVIDGYPDESATVIRGSVNIHVLLSFVQDSFCLLNMYKFT